MTFREIVGRIMSWRRRDDLARALEADVEAHIALLARDLEHDGLSAAEARTEARRQVGSVTRLREESQEYWGFPSVDRVVQDVRYALRGLRRSPGFTVTIILTLSLGIGANAAMFGVIDRLMFRPYPYMRDPASVNRVYLQTTVRGRTTANITFPYLRYRDLSAAAGPVARFAAHSEWRFAVGTGDASRVRRVSGVSASFFDFFDARPSLGRYFTAAEDSTPMGALVAVISHAFWTSDFGSADVIGRRLKVGMLDYTIIGVTPPGFMGAGGGRTPELFVPVTTIPANLGQWSQQRYLVDYSQDWILVLVRRAPHVTTRAASAALTAAYIQSRARARALNPRVLPDSVAHPRAIAGPVKTAAGPDAGLESRVLLWVMGVAAIVLFIACANVANLMLARVIRRRREITVRLALGVSRSRLAAQFLTEGFVLALLGGAAGVVVAQWAGAAIRGLLLPDGSSFNLADDWRTLGVALACASGAALLTAIGPAVVATRSDLATMLKSGARDGTYHRSPTRVVLLVLQGAMSVLLLVGAGLFVRSLNNARSVPLGYDARPVIEVFADFRGFEMDSATSVVTRRRLLAAAQSLPGVEYAARVNSRLFGTNTADLRVDGIDSVEALGRFNFQISSPDYFNVMRIRILRGRGLTESDRAGAPLVAVVSDAMARALWPGKEAIGQCMRVSLRGLSQSGAQCTTVVGIAENTAQQNIGDDPRFMYYLPVEQFAPDGLSTMLLRMRDADARTQMEPVRREMTRAMPGDGFVVVRPLQEVVDDQTRSWRLGATLFVAFGGLALVVALVGLYGVVSYNVAHRRHELSIRVALGARAGDIVRLVVAQGVRFAVAGVVIGLGTSLFAARWIQPLLFRQSAIDVATYAEVGGAIILAAVAASALPAVRAGRADPNEALRSD